MHRAVASVPPTLSPPMARRCASRPWRPPCSSSQAGRPVRRGRRWESGALAPAGSRWPAHCRACPAPGCGTGCHAIRARPARSRRREGTAGRARLCVQGLRGRAGRGYARRRAWADPGPRWADRRPAGPAPAWRCRRRRAPALPSSGSCAGGWMPGRWRVQEMLAGRGGEPWRPSGVRQTRQSGPVQGMAPALPLLRDDAGRRNLFIAWAVNIFGARTSCRE